MTLASLAIARSATVPVIVHLDHAEDVALVHEAVALGIDSVMYDGSALPWEDNITTTRAVVEHCHKNRVHVEAELGKVGGKDGVHAPARHPRECTECTVREPRYRDRRDGCCTTLRPPAKASASPKRCQAKG